jgi:hypothetical protein
MLTFYRLTIGLPFDISAFGNLVLDIELYTAQLQHAPKKTNYLDRSL